METNENILIRANGFIPLSEIDPNIYFDTKANKANDPNNILTDMFRDKKSPDIANPDKPRPLKGHDILKIENISHKQDWTPIDSIFNFNWDAIPRGQFIQLSKNIKTRLIFDNPDLKVVELAIAPGGLLPFHAQPTPSAYHILGGEAEIISGDSMTYAAIGTSIKFDRYSKKELR